MTLRCLEQVLHDVCYHSSNLALAGSGGTYGALGFPIRLLMMLLSAERCQVLESAHQPAAAK